MRRYLMMTGAAFGLAVFAGAPAKAATPSEPIKVTGEVIDTWCYYSGVMGAAEATLGTAHHTCALWCAAGGIPVGVLADDGTVYMVLKIAGKAPLADPKSLLKIQSNRIDATGRLFVRDGIKYLVVENVESGGIVNLSHEDYGVVPPFAIPEPKK